jgi:hypothetical protein
MRAAISSRNDQKNHARSSMIASETTLKKSMSQRTQLAPNPTIALFIRSIIRGRSFSHSLVVTLPAWLKTAWL